jgi:hypothetical protein
MSIIEAKVILYFDNSKNHIYFFKIFNCSIYICLILNGLLSKESGIGNPTFLQPN